MKIKKIGHCCLILDIKGKKIMTDPGFWTKKEQIKEKNIDIILITHEHSDHLHVGSLKKIIKNNPKVIIITNKGVGNLLNKEGIKYRILENKIQTNVLGIKIEAHEAKHEEIYKEIAQVENTGYFIDKKLFYPGDAFYKPDDNVEILALPVAGPWVNVKNAINYALDVNPKVCFPIHDGMLKSFGASHRIPLLVLVEKEILFKDFKNNNEIEI